MRGTVIDSFHSGCGNRNGNRHRRWRCHGATLCGPADTVALRRTAEDPAGAAGLTVSSCAGCRWAAACVPAGLSPGNRRSISAAAAIAPDRSKAARTLAASASSMANIRQTWAPCRRRGKRRFSGCLISRPMPGHRPAGFGREAAGAYGPGASRTRRRFVVQIGRGTGETSGRRPSATRPRRMRDSDATHPRQLDRPICTDALQVLSASGPIVPRHETFLSSAVGRPQLAGASGAVSAAGPHRAARTPTDRAQRPLGSPPSAPGRSAPADPVRPAHRAHVPRNGP